MSVPYVFANAVGSIPLSELDANFAQVAAYSNTAGTVTASSQPNVTSLGTLVNLSATGNITANYFLGNGSQLTGIVANTTYNNSNVASYLPTYTGNFTANNITITGVYIGNGSGLSQITGGNVVGIVANAALANLANLATAATTATVANTVSTAAQPNITSVGNLTSLTVTGNASAGNINTNILTANTLSGTLSTAAQPNITSVGNLSTLIVTGNASGGNILTAGIVSATGNIVTDGFFVGTFVGNITGNLTVPGGNTQVIYNNNGNAGASAGFTFDSAANAMAVSGTLSASGNVTGGNLLTSGNVSANYLLGNGSQLTSLPVATYIQNGNSNVVVFANDAVTISANGASNVAAFRPSSFLPGTYIMQMAGAIFATGNILSNTQVSATGNVTGGNIITGGLISATGNVTSNGNIASFTQSIFKNNLGTLSGNVNIDVSNSSYQPITTGGNITLSFANWAPAGEYREVTLAIDITNTSHLITAPSGIVNSQGIIGLDYVTSTFTAPVTGIYEFTFSSSDNGGTIRVAEDNTILRPYNASSELVSNTSNAYLSLGTNYSIFYPANSLSSGTAILSNGVPGQIKTIGSLSLGTWVVTVPGASWGGSNVITFNNAGEQMQLVWASGFNYWFPLNTFGNPVLS